MTAGPDNKEVGREPGLVTDVHAVFAFWRGRHDPNPTGMDRVGSMWISCVRGLSLESINEFIAACPELAHDDWHGGHYFRYFLPEHLSQARFGNYSTPAPIPSDAILKLAQEIVNILGDCPGALDVVVRALQAQVRRLTR